MKLTHMKGNVFFSEATGLNVNFIQKKNTFTETFRMFDQISELQGPAKLTQKFERRTQ